jgi:hypothetical protein
MLDGLPIERRSEADEARGQGAHGMAKPHFMLRTNRDLYVWGARYLEWQRWGYISITGGISQYTRVPMVIPLLWRKPDPQY